MDKIFEIAPKVTTPLILAGVVFIAIFLVFREIVRRNKLPALIKTLSPEVIMSIVKGFRLVAVLALLLAFAGYLITALKTPTTQETYRRPEPIKDEPKEVEYRVRVVDAKTNKLLENARVSITAPGIDVAGYTNSDGFYGTKLSPSPKSVHLRVTADGYQNYESDPSVAGKNFEDVHLTPNSTSPQQTPANQTGASANKSRSGSSVSGKSIVRRAGKQGSPVLHKQIENFDKALNYRGQTSQR